MSQRIARLVGESEKAVTKLLSELENKNSFPSHDVRHIAEVHQQVRQKMLGLYLDPEDTTAQELHQALMVKYTADCRQIDRIYGVSGKTFDQKMKLAAALIKKSGQLPQVWALKNTAAKDLLRKQQPKQVMKYLRYRSIESFIKRQNVAETMLAAQLLGSPSWLKMHSRLVSKLDQAAFELRDITLACLNYDKWSDVNTDAYLVTAEEAGTLAIWPSEASKNAPLLSIALILIEELQSYGTKITAAEIFKQDNTLDWWDQNHHLIADLPGGLVSLNLQDVATCHALGTNFEDRGLEKSRQHYWQQLLAKYEKAVDTGDIFDNSIINEVKKLKFKAPQPAFEYEFAEDL